MSFRRLVQFALSRRENILMMLGVGSVASELMWIIRIRNQRDIIRTDTDTSIKTIQQQIDALKRGEQIQIEAPAPKDSAEEILAQLQELDRKWRAESEVVLPRAPKEPVEPVEAKPKQAKFL